MVDKPKRLAYIDGMTKPNTPETAAAVQLLYACAGQTKVLPLAGREMLFRAIHHLTGKPMKRIVQTWEATRYAS